VFLGLTIAVFPAGPAAAQTRVDLFDKSSNRTGYAIVDDKSGWIELYDKASNRIGYGRISPGGRVDLFDSRSNRLGSGTVNSLPSASTTRRR
jgi:hypothetical protein